MPRFYFDVREDGKFFPDEDGQELADVDAAELEAAYSAASICHDLLPTGKTRQVVLEVRNDQGQRVLTATVTFEIARAESAPIAPTSGRNSN